MYQVFLGKISSLSTNRWAQALSRHAPEGAHRARWLAGRGLLSRLLAPTSLPEIIHNEQGKPLFAGDYPLWFSLSHSGDEIALIISDEGTWAVPWNVFARRITGARSPMPSSAAPSMKSWKRKRQSASLRHSGVSGRERKRSLNSAAVTPGKWLALTVPPARFIQSATAA